MASKKELYMMGWILKGIFLKWQSGGVPPLYCTSFSSSTWKLVSSSLHCPQFCIKPSQKMRYVIWRKSIEVQWRAFINKPVSKKFKKKNAKKWKKKVKFLNPISFIQFASIPIFVPSIDKKGVSLAFCGNIFYVVCF